MRGLAAWLMVAGTISLPMNLAHSVARDSGDDRAEDRAAIAAVVQSEGDAWNRGDAEAFAAHYAEDGSFTNVFGQQLYGKPAFVKQHAMLFGSVYKGSHNTLTIGKIKFLRPDVAVVDIDGALANVQHVPPGLTMGADGALHVKLQEVMSRENGTWMIAAFHNVAVAPPPTPRP